MYVRRIVALTLMLIFSAVLTSQALGQDLVDVLLSLEKINKRLSQLESTQKQDIQKLEKQIATGEPISGGGADQGALNSAVDDLKLQLSQLQQAMGNYQALDQSLTALSGRFDGLEKQLTDVKNSPNPTSSSMIPPDLVAELRNLTGEVKSAISKPTAPPTAPTPADGKTAVSKYDLKMYGFIKLEAIRDNTEVVRGDLLYYTNKGGTAQARQEVFSMNARQSRLGLKIGGPAIGAKGKANALVEVDFAGGFPNSATAARQPNIRLRSAWVELFYPKWELKFGQDPAIISGPNPNTNSFTTLNCAGNLSMNYSQITFTLKETPMKFAVSITRPMTGDTKYEEYASGDMDPIDTGERTAMPWLMSRVWFTPNKHVTTSVSTHYGTKKINDLSATPHTNSSYSVNGDVVLKFWRLSFTSRGFYGENLNSFYGGINQGFTIDSTSVKNIGSAGGWAQLLYDISDSWATTLGAGIDDPKNADLNSGMRARNEMVFSNVVYKIQKTIELVGEIDFMRTQYLNASTGRNLRFQFASYFRF
jgi:hypothetical protein